MRTIFARKNISRLALLLGTIAWAFPPVPQFLAAQEPAAKEAPTAGTAQGTPPETFGSPEEAVKALVTAAEQFDTAALLKIFGSDGKDIVLTGDLAQDRQRAIAFAAEAREKESISVQPTGGRRAFLLVGNENWPFPVPLVKVGDKWHFDSKAGKQELLYRRIGANELDAIQICRGYVEAQVEYAEEPRQGYNVNQYAQRVLATPGKQDGLAWRNPDGTFGGPIGENIAEAIAQGYTSREQPYHGYFFKVLKGQGPAAPMGEMNYVIKGVMIGGFALVAAPAQYRVTGVKTFIVSNDGVVYQKDLGPSTLDIFKKMELYNPDKSWTPVEEEQDAN